MDRSRWNSGSSFQIETEREREREKGIFGMSVVPVLHVVD